MGRRNSSDDKKRIPGGISGQRDNQNQGRSGVGKFLNNLTGGDSEKSDQSGGRNPLGGLINNARSRLGGGDNQGSGLVGGLATRLGGNRGGSDTVSQRGGSQSSRNQGRNQRSSSNQKNSSRNSRPSQDRQSSSNQRSNQYSDKSNQQDNRGQSGRQGGQQGRSGGSQSYKDGNLPMGSGKKSSSTGFQTTGGNARQGSPSNRDSQFNRSKDQSSQRSSKPSDRSGGFQRQDNRGQSSVRQSGGQQGRTTSSGSGFSRDKSGSAPIGGQRQTGSRPQLTSQKPSGSGALPGGVRQGSQQMGTGSSKPAASTGKAGTRDKKGPLSNVLGKKSSAKKQGAGMPGGVAPASTKAAAASTQAKKTTRNRTQSDELLSLDTKLDILGGFLIIFALIILLSFLSGSPGTLTRRLLRALYQGFGWGAYFVPVALGAIGVWLLWDHFGDQLPDLEPIRIIGVVIVYLSVLTLLQAILVAFAPVGYVYVDPVLSDPAYPGYTPDLMWESAVACPAKPQDYLENRWVLQQAYLDSYQIAQCGYGGGFIGAWIQTSLSGLLGTLPLFLIMLVTVFGGVLMMLKMPLDEAMNKIGAGIKKLRQKRQQKATATGKVQPAAAGGVAAPAITGRPSIVTGKGPAGQSPDGRAKKSTQSENQKPGRLEVPPRPGSSPRTQASQKQRAVSGKPAGDSPLPALGELQKGAATAAAGVAGASRRPGQPQRPVNRSDASQSSRPDSRSGQPDRFKKPQNRDGLSQQEKSQAGKPGSPDRRKFNPTDRPASSVAGSASLSSVASSSPRDGETPSIPRPKSRLESRNISGIKPGSDSPSHASGNPARLGHLNTPQHREVKPPPRPRHFPGAQQPAHTSTSTSHNSPGDRVAIPSVVPEDKRKPQPSTVQRPDATISDNRPARSGGEMKERVQSNAMESAKPSESSFRRQDRTSIEVNNLKDDADARSQAGPPKSSVKRDDKGPRRLDSSPQPVQKKGPVINWDLPAMNLLQPSAMKKMSEQDLKYKASVIEQTLSSFGAPGRVVEVNSGPVITQFGVEPDYVEGRAGKKIKVKVGKIAALSDDLALVLAAPTIRIEAPVPGKGYVGIEVPNDTPSIVGLRDAMDTEEFKSLESPLVLALGHDVSGHPRVADLTKMPHLLVAGTTGSGKSVCVNGIISTMLMTNSPESLKMIMVDPKRVELTGYNGIPHLLTPVVTELERILSVLKWIQREMEERYRRFALVGARNIVDHNQRIDDGRAQGQEKMPYILVIIDELADLMMQAPDETERLLTRLAQMARATGIHLIISTQRPSVDVVTGVIKANFPARIAFAVATGVDSRVIIDMPGAEKLLGSGDMLFQAPDSPLPVRLQGVFTSDKEIDAIVNFWREQSAKKGGASQTRTLEELQKATSGFSSASTDGMTQSSMFKSDDGEAVDELFSEAVDLVRDMGKASTSLLQRHLRIGYTRSARLIDLMEEKGIIGSHEGGSKPRVVYDSEGQVIEGSDAL